MARPHEVIGRPAGAKSGGLRRHEYTAPLIAAGPLAVTQSSYRDSRDEHELMDILHVHGLVAVNTFHDPYPYTYCGTGTWSQLDYLFMPPIRLAARGGGYRVPLLARVPKKWRIWYSARSRGFSRHDLTRRIEAQAAPAQSMALQSSPTCTDAPRKLTRLSSVLSGSSQQAHLCVMGTVSGRGNPRSSKQRWLRPGNICARLDLSGDTVCATCFRRGDIRSYFLSQAGQAHEKFTQKTPPPQTACYSQ